MADGFRALAGPSFVMGVNEEGGRISPLAGVDGFPITPAASRLATDGSEALHFAYKSLGEALSDWGFSVSFAPVANLSGNEGRIISGGCCFGSKPEIVSPAVGEAVRTLLRCHIEPCVRCFPGVYPEESDKRTGKLSQARVPDRLHSAEWAPFVQGFSAGARIVMVGHTPLPEATGDNTPSSLSPTVVTHCLREELGFDGLVVTASMERAEIVDLYPSGELAVRALEAGCDIILMPEDLKSAHKSVREAVELGRLTESRLDESIRRRMEIFDFAA
jgi:beta-N-acetylhexosaminidase